MRYYIQRGGQEYGPYSLVDVQGFLKQGSLQPTDSSRSESMAGWLPLEELLRQPAQIPAPPLPPGPPPLAGVPAGAVVAAARESAAPYSPGPSPEGNALTWPFFQEDWLISLWMVMVWWIPIVGPVLSKGWSLDVVRRKGRAERSLMPQPGDVGRLLADGAISWLMWILYFAIPIFLLEVLTSFGVLIVLWETVKGLWNFIWGNPVAMSLSAYLWRQLLALLARAAAPIVYSAVAAPFFIAAQVRYVETGRASSFFNLIDNASLVSRHFPEFLTVMFLTSAAEVCFWTVQFMLTMTGFGVIVAILLAGAETWVVAYLMGNLAAQIHPGLARQGSVAGRS